MNRVLSTARAIAQQSPIEYSVERPVPRWLVIGTGVLGALVAAEFIVGLVAVA